MESTVAEIMKPAKDPIVERLKAEPTSGHAFPPYKAVEYQPGGFAGVENARGFNCLSFPHSPGRVFTDMETATRIAKEWNAESGFPDKN